MLIDTANSLIKQVTFWEPDFFQNFQIWTKERKKMPGNIKKSDGPDPDPSPWLIVSPELKVKLKSKPYDPKKSCWVPNKATHGYDEGLIDSTEGDKVTVMILETKEVSQRNWYFNYHHLI